MWEGHVCDDSQHIKVIRYRRGENFIRFEWGIDEGRNITPEEIKTVSKWDKNDRQCEVVLFDGTCFLVPLSMEAFQNVHFINAGKKPEQGV